MNFYDIIPASAQILQPSPFLGAVSLVDVNPDLAIKSIRLNPDSTIAGVEKLILVSKPMRRKDGSFLVEAISRRHLNIVHPNVEHGEFEECCYQELNLADLGVTPYPDGSWHKSAYCIIDRE